jgi:hypothetical protein
VTSELDNAARDSGEMPDADTEKVAAEAAHDELPPAIKEALEKERKSRREAEKALKAAQSRLSEIEDADKTETQRLSESVRSLTARAEQAEALASRVLVATRKGLPAELAQRLVGKNEAELEADADRLKKMLAPTSPPMDGGVRSDAKPQKQDINSLLAAALDH